MTQLQSQKAINTSPNVSHTGTSNDELRIEHRQRVLKGGTIYFNKGYASFQCRIRNLTEKGALLEFGETTGIPKNFDFKISGEPESNPASLVWKNSKQVGISFA